MNIPLGIASSIAREYRYDPFFTLNFAVKHHISVVQFFLDTALLMDENFFHAVCAAIPDSIHICCHSPFSLDDSLQSNLSLFNKAQHFLRKENAKYFILHFNPETAPEKALDICKSIHEQYGLIPCVENFYPDISPRKFVRHFSGYQQFFEKARCQNLTIYSVIDIPRLFITPIASHFHSLYLTGELFQCMVQLQIPVIWHCIDFTHSDQQRNQWTAIGKGLMPYERILSNELFSKIDSKAFILEFENPEHVLESLSFLNHVDKSYSITIA